MIPLRRSYFLFSQLVSSQKINSNIAVITLLNDKKRNPLSQESLNQLLQSFTTIQNDKTTKVVILKSTGPVFSAGHDLKEISANTPEQNAKIFSTLAQVCLTIRNLPQPVIAQVDGLATAAGCQLVLACDLITASKQASFCTPGLKVGLFCTTPGVELARSLPQTKIAMEMLLTADAIQADEAHRLGLINRLCKSTELDQVTLELADKIAHFSGESVALGKKTFYQQSSMGHSDAYEVGCKVMVDSLSLEDCKEGIKAFTEKRHPHFKN